MADTFARMRQLIASSSEWSIDDLTLGDGEIGVEKTADGKMKMKVGNGLLKFSQLPYIGGAFDQTAGDARYVQLSGGIMTGDLSLKPNGSPTANMAITKAYADVQYALPHATAVNQILVSGPSTGFPWQVGDLDEGRY